MEFNQLESFINVVNLKSFSKAAEKLFLTQPTVSNNVQSLEKELGTVLINRNNKRITVTAEGELLYSYAVNMLNMRDRASSEIGKLKGRICGNLELSSSTIPQEYILPRYLKEFSVMYPDMTFTINQKDSKNVVDDVIKGYTNYGITGAVYESKQLEYIPFYEDRIVLAVPHCHRFQFDDYEEIDFKLLSTEKLIMREEGSGTRKILEKAFADSGLSISSMDIVSSVESNETIKKMVELDMGITFMSEIAIKNEIKLNLIKPLLVKGLDIRRQFYFVYSKNRYLSPLAEKFKKFLIS
ncbi:DNA-binding transcriptional regulator, LysR family [Dethiosulfatibacter aminovorans DSM 17477]|uniref:DNA-binding transcriptional regulator, LysR family n=1 Tax=Dethiosulfatibacter aminovorans DSM 17477 TaxID=1121476 RepID=A0A1M6JCM0_9FIRM|nr:selenium metabolism-associated LysR family transcriptional regulator [Dethiosulfatibacter aminovorans]SHJ44418.1 DNA-binding transcriptional regulator, LysR family [Dethiosulfatibacter aminovorans DSM 17477]